MVVVMVMVTWVTVREWVCANILLQQRQAFLALRRESTDAGPGLILVGDSSFVLPLYFYSDEEDRRRIFFPIDFNAIHRFEPDDSGEQNLWAGRDGVFPFKVATLRAGATLRPGDVLIGRPDGWLARTVAPQGVALRAAGEDLDWGRIGGVFTPMGHEATRILIVARASSEGL
jgi:hypothetical protein